ncbi:MAG: MotA/TolQ/ExbB proton channel family protein [Coriobacteriia bacterium]|jgi:biopolymer transport protein ExbB/TolQ|nr:MotA/TolQ/ExbB proton channel family protein [Coriobacteriia bacterium]
MHVLARVGESLQAIIYSVASILLYPVLAFLVLGLVLAMYEAGGFTLEAIRRRRANRGFDLDATATKLAGPSADATLSQVLLQLKARPAMARAQTSLGDATDLSRTRTLKALADAEIEVTRRLEHTRVLVRIGPMLGLMGTLIPISPALVGLAQGDVDTLANNLVIAFSTTVVGLLIAGVAYMITSVRTRLYQQDIVDLEYLLDRAEV